MLHVECKRIQQRRRSWSFWAVWVSVWVGGGGAPVWGEEGDPPVCIMNEGDQLVVRPGPCPELMRTGPAEAQRASGESVEPASSAEPASLRTTSGAASAREQVWQDPHPEGALTPGQLRAALVEMATASSEDLGLQAFEALVARGPQIVPGVASVFLDGKEDPRVRWVAGRALGRLPSSQSLVALEKGFKESVPLVRVASVKAATELSARALLPAIEGAVGDKAAVVRAAALDGVAVLGSRAHVSLVAGQLKDPRNFAKGKSIFVRTHAVSALGRLGGHEAIEALVSVADDPDADVRDATREALLRASGRSTVPSGAGSASERWKTWLAGQK